MKNFESVKRQILINAGLAYLSEVHYNLLKKASTPLDLLFALKKDIPAVVRDGIINEELILEFSHHALELSNIYLNQRFQKRIDGFSEVVLLGDSQAYIEVNDSARIYCFNDSKLTLKSYRYSLSYISSYNKSHTTIEATDKSTVSISAHDQSIIVGEAWASSVISVWDKDDANVNLQNKGNKSIINDLANSKIHVYEGVKIV